MYPGWLSVWYCSRNVTSDVDISCSLPMSIMLFCNFTDMFFLRRSARICPGQYDNISSIISWGYIELFGKLRLCKKNK